MYRKYLMDRIQRQWTWTITGQYLRALAGMRFPRVGASECDLMFDLVPEPARGRLPDLLVQRLLHKHARLWGRAFQTAPNRDAAQFLQRQQLRRGVRKLPVQFPCRRLDCRPVISYSGDRCGRDSGEPITVAGNPPMRFASASFEAANGTQGHRISPLPTRTSSMISSASACCLSPKGSSSQSCTFVCCEGRHTPVGHCGDCFVVHGSQPGSDLRRDQEVPGRQQMGCR